MAKISRMLANPHLWFAKVRLFVSFTDSVSPITFLSQSLDRLLKAGEVGNWFDIGYNYSKRIRSYYTGTGGDLKPDCSKPVYVK